MYAAYLLDQLGCYHVQLFEGGPQLGGHTDTHQVSCNEHGVEGALTIDTGFIVFNRNNYPLFAGMLDDLGVQSQPSNMSFSVHYEQSGGYEYAAGRKGGLFSQKRNLLDLHFWRMLLDIVRFYRSSQRLLNSIDSALTLGDYLDQAGYSKAYAEWHILPMTAALWSCSLVQARQVPLSFLLDFMHAHDMLSLKNRPQWECVKGGSQSYVRALLGHWSVVVHTDSPVTQIKRYSDSVELLVNGESVLVDGVVLACHSDQALAVLGDASESEREILGAIRYADNEMVLHTDTALLPDNPGAWASWNALIPENASAPCAVSYWMNLLQSLPGDTQFITSLNQTHRVDPEKILLKRHYAHPVIDVASRAAVQRWSEINGQQRTWFCGAYWGWGFHEDGARSAAHVVENIQAHNLASRPITMHTLAS